MVNSCYACIYSEGKDRTVVGTPDTTEENPCDKSDIDLFSEDEYEVDSDEFFHTLIEKYNDNGDEEK